MESLREILMGYWIEPGVWKPASSMPWPQQKNPQACLFLPLLEKLKPSWITQRLWNFQRVRQLALSSRMEYTFAHAQGAPHLIPTVIETENTENFWSPRSSEYEYRNCLQLQIWRDKDKAKMASDSKALISRLPGCQESPKHYPSLPSNFIFWIWTWNNF